jgi:hypothetical protein
MTRRQTKTHKSEQTDVGGTSILSSEKRRMRQYIYTSTHESTHTHKVQSFRSYDVCVRERLILCVCVCVCVCIYGRVGKGMEQKSKKAGMEVCSRARVCVLVCVCFDPTLTIACCFFFSLLYYYMTI